MMHISPLTHEIARIEHRNAVRGTLIDPRQKPRRASAATLLRRTRRRNP